ncbi:hypothetical protein diail_11690 [Diaporthe ilicicola]|nr:hypothetical protein diail_11690 [Diaporthe ilicicola]
MVDQTASRLVTARLERRQLLTAVNILAGMSIFFFGYDQDVLKRLRGTENGVAEAEYDDIRRVVELEKSFEGTSYIQMFFGIKSGRLHTGRRVQLVI